MKTNPNDPAQPEIISKTIYAKTSEGPSAPLIEISSAGGLTKLEHFAALAMQGMLANSHDFAEKNAAKLAEWSVTYAKHLIAALNNHYEHTK